jgi:hypothetical protein
MIAFPASEQQLALLVQPLFSSFRGVVMVTRLVVLVSSHRQAGRGGGGAAAGVFACRATAAGHLNCPITCGCGRMLYRGLFIFLKYYA